VIAQCNLIYGALTLDRIMQCVPRTW